MFEFEEEPGWRFALALRRSLAEEVEVEVEEVGASAVVVCGLPAGSAVSACPLIDRKSGGLLAMASICVCTLVLTASPS